MHSIYTQFEKAGYASTSARRAILGWISGRSGIFSALDIVRSLPELDKVTVYRTLQLLADIDAIDAVLVRDGVQYFEIHDHKEHHHHIVCTECDVAECIPCDFTKRFKNFTSVHHSIAVTGVCTNCI